MPTVRVKPAPVLLIVEASPAFVRRCSDIAIQAQALVVEASAESISTLAAQTRAFAVMAPARVHKAHEAIFNVMVRETGLRLIVLANEDIPTSELENHIFSAMDEAEKTRFERAHRAKVS